MRVLLFNKFAESVRFESACIAFIGIDMGFQVEALVDANNDIVKGYRAWAVDFHFHDVEVLDSVEGGIVWVHVHVWLGANNAFIHFEVSVGSH